MTIFGTCIDKRVLIGLAALALGIWITAPQVVAAALPLLLLLLCPLSMMFMMRGGHGRHDSGGPWMAGSVEPSGVPDHQRR